MNQGKTMFQRLGRLSHRMSDFHEECKQDVKRTDDVDVIDEPESYLGMLGKRLFMPLFALFAPSGAKYGIALGVGLMEWGTGVFSRTFTPNWPQVLLILAAIAIDFITGHTRAKREGEDIQSQVARQTVYKMAEYLGLYWLAVGADNVLLDGANALRWTATALIVYVEGRSVEENVWGKAGYLTNMIWKRFFPDAEQPEEIS